MLFFLSDACSRSIRATVLFKYFVYMQYHNFVLAYHCALSGSPVSLLKSIITVWKGAM